MNGKQIVSLVVVAIVFAGGGFFGGMKYAQSKAPAIPAGRGQFAGQGFGGRGARGANGMAFVGGQVMSVDNGTITVKLMNGGSQIIILAPSTQFRKAVDGTAADVAVGKQITVTGSQNSDGSLTAQNVQIRNMAPNATSTPQ